MKTISIPEQLKICDYSTPLAIGSFVLGTLLFAGYFAFSANAALLFIGFFYVALAALVNGTMLLYLGYIFMRFPAERENTTVKILLLLTNIPVAIIFAYIILTDATHQPNFF